MNTVIYRILSLSLPLFLVALSAQPAFAEGDPEQGKVLGYTCLGCHGIEGYRNAYPSYRVPKLGGQKSDYIEAALTAYRDGSRPHPTMQAQGGTLSDQDIENLAAHFSSFGDAGDAITASDVTGNDAATICVSCHGAAGADVVPAPPTLAGQHQDYLERALSQYKDGARSGNVMTAFAASLSDADIRMLAGLYAAQDGLNTPIAGR